MEIKLRELREERGYTVSQMIQRLGVKDSRYRKWESNSAQIPLDFACQCADILHCTLDELAGRKTLRPVASAEISMTDDERRMVDVYRNTSQTNRDMIDALIETATRHMDEDALKEAQGA